MEEIEVNSDVFWQGAETVVFSHPDFREESALLAEKLAGEPGLAAHVVFRTSGSTGAAKHVCLSKQALLVSAAGINRHLRVTRADRWLRALPLYHVGGFGIHARAFRGGNAVIVADGKWEPRRFAETCHEEGITLTSLVPAQVFDLVEARLEGAVSLRAVVVGGGTLPEDVGNEARRLGWPVLQSYGLTEAGSQVATAGLESLGERFTNGGLPILEFWEARINARGVLELSGDGLFTAYAGLDDGQLVIEAQRGWFATGDRVALRENEGGERFVTFDVREGDLVKILGELVSLGELRERLGRMAGEAGLGLGVALAAVPDARRGVRLVLATDSRGGGDAIAGVTKKFNAAVRGFERIEEVREVREIPVSGAGKIAYGRLAALLGEGAGSGK